MRCAIVRWMISRTEDTGRGMPRWAERHAGRCRSCRDFARATASLASRLRSEQAAVLAAVPEFRGGRSLDLEPSGEAGTGTARRERSRLPRLVLRPLPVAAALLLVVAAAAWLVLRAPRPEPGTAALDPAAARAAIERLAAAPKDLRQALDKAESPLERERRALERLVASAADYLGDRLNVRIERKAAAKDL